MGRRVSFPTAHVYEQPGPWRRASQGGPRACTPFDDHADDRSVFANGHGRPDRRAGAAAGPVPGHRKSVRTSTGDRDPRYRREKRSIPGPPYGPLFGPTRTASQLSPRAWRCTKTDDDTELSYRENPTKQRVYCTSLHSVAPTYTDIDGLRVLGLEPRTHGLKGRCSTTELHPR